MVTGIGEFVVQALAITSVVTKNKINKMKRVFFELVYTLH